LTCFSSCQSSSAQLVTLTCCIGVRVRAQCGPRVCLARAGVLSQAMSDGGGKRHTFVCACLVASASVATLGTSVALFWKSRESLLVNSHNQLVATDQKPVTTSVATVSLPLHYALLLSIDQLADVQSVTFQQCVEGERAQVAARVLSARLGSINITSDIGSEEVANGTADEVGKTTVDFAVAGGLVLHIDITTALLVDPVHNLSTPLCGNLSCGAMRLQDRDIAAIEKRAAAATAAARRRHGRRLRFNRGFNGFYDFGGGLPPNVFGSSGGFTCPPCRLMR